jgi:hypothetical protein
LVPITTKVGAPRLGLLGDDAENLPYLNVVGNVGDALCLQPFGQVVQPLFVNFHQFEHKQVVHRIVLHLSHGAEAAAHRGVHHVEQMQLGTAAAGQVGGYVQGIAGFGRKISRNQ